jgi:Sec-independent protein translocase protein TatA
MAPYKRLGELTRRLYGYLRRVYNAIKSDQKTIKRDQKTIKRDQNTTKSDHINHLPHQNKGNQQKIKSAAKCIEPMENIFFGPRPHPR